MRPAVPGGFSRASSLHCRWDGWVVVLLMLLGASVSAQTTQTFYSPAGQLNSIDDSFFSARAIALGSAFTGVADDAGALSANPAGLAWLTRGEISLSTHLGAADTLLETLVVALPVEGRGSLGLAANYLDDGSMEGRDSLGALTSSYSANRIGFQAGWGGPINGNFSIGASLKAFQQSTAGIGSSSLTPEAGLLWNPLERLRIGLDYSASGWGSLAGSVDSFLKAGVSYRLQVDSTFEILGALDNSLELNSLDYLQGGIEAALQSRYFLRAGYRTPLGPTGYDGFSDFSFGAGICLAGFTLDYAFSPMGDLGNNHRFSLTYPFGGKEEEPGPKTVSKVLTGQGNKSTEKRTLVQAGPLGLSQTSSSLGPPNGAGKSTGVSGAIPATTPGSTVTPGSLGSSLSVSNPVADNGTKTGVMQNQTPGSTGANGQSVSTPSVSNPAVDNVTVAGGSVTVFDPSRDAAWSQPLPDSQGNTGESLHLQFVVPSDFKAQADAQASQGHWVEAGHLYLQALQQNDQDAEVWRALGNCYFRLRQKNYAISCFEKYLTLNPGDMALRAWLDQYKNQ